MSETSEQPTRLHVVTPAPHPEPATVLSVAGSTPFPGEHVCDGYVCDFPACVAERATRVREGVRPRRPVPVKRAETLHLRAVIAQGAQDDERELHQEFAGDRLQGEWFTPTFRLMERVVLARRSRPANPAELRAARNGGYNEAVQVMRRAPGHSAALGEVVERELTYDQGKGAVLEATAERAEQ